MMKRKKEIRTAQINSANEEGQLKVRGYAAVFNEPTLIWESEYSGYKYFETVDRNAFEGADMSDVCFKYNHGDVAMILARTRNKTLTLAADDHGLAIQADIADTSTGKDVYELIRRGDLDKMSFAFTVEKQKVEYDERAKTCIRTILKFDKIFDVAVVDFPAYDGTEISTVEARGAEYFRKLEEKMREQEERKKLLLRTYF